MFKTISAAAIALSLIAAPAFAQGANSPANAPAGAITTPAKPVVHKAHQTRKHVAHKHIVKKHLAHKHGVNKHVAKKHVKPVKLTTAKAGIKSVKPKAAI